LSEFSDWWQIIDSTLMIRPMATVECS